MTLDEAKAALAAKREQLVTYRNGIDGDGPVAVHARATANGRIAQVELDIAVLNEIAA